MGYFDENRKFLGVTGVLGRRDFIVNCLIIELIEGLLFLTPFVYGMIFFPDIRDIALGNVRPLWYMIVQCVVAVVSTALYYPSVVRRVRDIIGEEDDNRINMISAIIAVIIFMGYTPVAANVFGSWLLVFTICSLIFMNGKITGEKPASEIIKFNWGAFFTTWVWGLFNKVPKTLVVIPLFLTVAWFPYMLICGLKGNEWAYEANKESVESVEAFHDKQNKQSVALGVLTPVIWLVSLIIILVMGIFGLRLTSKINPTIPDKIISFSQELQLSSAESGFERIEEKDGVYVFYIDPAEWSLISSERLKRSVIDSAINYTLIKNNKPILSFEDRLKSIELINSVKVYSTFNNELLAEFYMEPKLAKEFLKTMEKDDEVFQKALEAYKSSYKYNNNPSY